MGIGIFGSSLSALNAAQTGLLTTEHNIANANTPGFNRQQIVQDTRLPLATGAGFIGQGVEVGTVKRLYNEFLSTQVLHEQSLASQLDTYYTQIKQIDNMLADPNAGLSPALRDFFGAVHNVASTPESPAARQAMLSAGQFMVARFQSMSQRITDMADGINSQISNSVTTINSYARQIATLNQNITLAQAAFSQQPPNDLLDQRDLLVANLNKEIKASVIKQSDGSFNVFIGNGQALVVGAQSFTLQAVQALDDPAKMEVAYTSTAGITRLQQGSFQGGNLGGLLEFRSQSLSATQNALGLVAMGLAGAFNAQHLLGQDLNGTLGGNFFAVASPQVNSNTANTGTATVSAAVADYTALTRSDYLLKYDGAAYTLTRLSDNTATVLGALPQTIDGLTISTSAGVLAGDSYTIRPTANGARDIALAINDPAKIAVAMAIRSNASLNNIGTGRIEAGSVNAPAPVNVNLQQTVNIVFNTPPTTFNVTGTGTGNPTNVPYTPGSTITYNGWSTKITGTPGAGDSFVMSSNTGATADNRNALLLAGLQTQNNMLSGTSSFQGVYSQLVSQVGNKTHELEVTSSAQAAMVSQTVQVQQSLSGVNLDEEAANLIRYQRAYQAAGKAMQIANSMFDTILDIGR